MKRFSEAALHDMEVLHKGQLNEIIELFVSAGRFQGQEESKLSFLTNTSKKRLDEALKGLKAQKKVILFDKERMVLIHADFLRQAKEEILETIGRYHRDFPLKSGLPKEELRSKTAGADNQKLFNFIINQLTNDGAIVQDEEIVHLKDHRVTLAEEEEETRHKLEQIYLKNGLQPPYFSELKDKFSGNKAADILGVMIKEGVLLKVKEDLYFHRSAVDDLQERLVGFLEKNGEITTQQFKDLTGVSRKYTIPLIEYFDLVQLTMRVGDSRVLRNK
jgi:selenocysteine-specific elongation factor